MIEQNGIKDSGTKTALSWHDRLPQHKVAEILDMVLRLKFMACTQAFLIPLSYRTRLRVLPVDAFEVIN